MKPAKEIIEIGGVILERSDVLADRLGITLPMLWRMRRAGKLPKPVRLGRLSFYPKHEVENRLLTEATAG
jgi:predicted DNA-binding transcriptional regulator AlpA